MATMFKKLRQKLLPAERKKALKAYWVKQRYGNTLSLEINQEAEAVIKQARSSFAGKGDKAKQAQFQQQGYFYVSSAIDQHVVAKLKSQFLALIDNPESSSCPFLGPDVDQAVKGAYNHSGGKMEWPEEEFSRHLKDVPRDMPEYTAIFTPQLVEAIEAHLGSHFMVDGVYGWRNKYVPEEILEYFEPTTGRWHFDHQYPDRLKFFVYLTDVTDKDGPFECFTKSYSRKLMDLGFSDEARKTSPTSGIPKHLLKNNPELIQHVGPQGTGLICATSFCIHRAGQQTEPGRYRDVLQYCLRPSLTRKFTVPMH